MKYRHGNTPYWGVLVLSVTFLSSAFAETFEGNISTGISSTPLYTGSDKYVLSPSIGYTFGLRDDDVGSVVLANSVLAWSLPLDSPVGITLFVRYDEGRDEIIKTGVIHRQKHDELKGMGDLTGTFFGGVKVSYLFDNYGIYVSGSQAFKPREYGGESIGRTAVIDVGVEGKAVINDALSTQWGLSTTWFNRGMMQADVGVSEKQARQTAFNRYMPTSGISRITLKTGVDYQFTSSFSLLAGVETYYLTEKMAKSSLVDNRWNVISYLGVKYSF